MTSVELLNAVRERLGDWATLGLTDELIYEWLTFAQYDILWRIHDGALLEHSEIASGSLSSSTFPIPDDFLRERTLIVNGVEARRWNFTEQDTIDTVISAPSSNSPYYYIWDTGEGPSGVVLVGDENSTLPYLLYYIKHPPALSGTTEPYLNRSLHDLMVQYAVMRARDTRREYEDWTRVSAWRGWNITSINSRYMPGLLNEGAPGDPIERTYQRTAKGWRRGRR